jgi:hypothetical protein
MASIQKMQQASLTAQEISSHAEIVDWKQRFMASMSA